MTGRRQRSDRAKGGKRSTGSSAEGSGESRPSTGPDCSASDKARAPLVVTGLFAGIGGIELGLARSGHRTELPSAGGAWILRSGLPGTAAVSAWIPQMSSESTRRWWRPRSDAASSASG